MIIRLSWDEPTDDTITKVYIYRSTTGKNGTYEELASIDAKDAGGDWVTSYVDQNGSLTYWYKIRFYNGSFSDYSTPINAIYNIRYTCLERVEELTGLSFSNTASSTTPSNTAVWNWISWAEDYVDHLLGYSFKIKNTVEYQSVDAPTTTIYTKHPFIYAINHIYSNKGTRINPDWDELTVNTDYNILDAKTGKIGLASSVSGDLALKIDYDYGIGEVPKIIEELTTYLVVRDVLKYVLNNKIQNVGQAITVGAIKISNKISDAYSFLISVENIIKDLEEKVGRLKIWVR